MPALRAMVGLIALAACGGSPTAEPLARPEPPPAMAPAPAPLVGASVEQCDRLLSHLIELEFRRYGAPADPRSKQAVIDSKRDEFQAVCTQETPAHKVECALAAVDLDGVAKCDEAP